MQVPILETFSSIQGEGYFAGTPAFFIRFAGCNKQCPFCDTPWETTPSTDMDLDDLIDLAINSNLNHIVITGGEPTLHLPELFYLTSRLSEYGLFPQIETNGSADLRGFRSWITVSPKDKNILTPFSNINEIKLLVNEQCNTASGHTLQDLTNPHTYLYLQPVDIPSPLPYYERILPIIKRITPMLHQNPLWRLSVQLHKLFNWR